LRKFYLQIYQSSEKPSFERERVRIDELPYQSLIIERLSALGAIDIEDNMLPANQIERIAKILRLRQSLGLNLSGATIICELLDRMEELENEIERQRNNSYEFISAD